MEFGFLSPLNLLFALAVAVPVAIHLLQRRREATVDFPAVLPPPRPAPLLPPPAAAPPAPAAPAVRVYGWTLLVRYGLAIFLNAFAANSAINVAFWGDSDTYDIGGAQLALRWSGEAVSSAYQLTSVSGYGWVYFVGTIYYLVGRNQLLIQFLNGMLGALTVLVIYAIAARLFGRAAARWAALFMAFFPQMVFWSAGMYKDPAILLCISVCMYAVLRLRERFSAGMIVLFVVSELALITLRFYIALHHICRKPVSAPADIRVELHLGASRLYPGWRIASRGRHRPEQPGSLAGNTKFTLETLALDGSGTRTPLPGTQPFDGVRLPYDMHFSPVGSKLAFSTSYHLSACAAPGAY